MVVLQLKKKQIYSKGKKKVVQEIVMFGPTSKLNKRTRQINVWDNIRDRNESRGQ